jgi:hypothetical protein
MKKLTASSLFALLALASVSAFAGEGYLGIGSAGFELGYGLKLQSNMGLRAEVNLLNLGHDFNSGGADYSAKLKFSNLGAFYDYFAAGNFRLTGGVLLGSRKLDGSAVTTGGTVIINGTAYPAPPGEGVTMSDTFSSAAPYLGIGFGHRQGSNGTGFYFDAGVAVGKSDVTFTATPGLVAAAGQANIDAEEAKVRDKLNQLKAYPVVKLGVSYAF